MTIRLSDRVRAENVEQELNKIIRELCHNLVRDDAMSPEQEAETSQNSFTALMDGLSKKTCGQLKDLVETCDALHGLIMEVARFRSMQLLLTPDADNHSMCEAEALMYEAMDELDANLKTTES